MSRDLRDYLAEVDALGELRRVSGADTKTDIGSITEITAWSAEHPMILFDEIVGFPKGWRVAVHSFDSYHRSRLLYRFPDGLRGRRLARWWKERLDSYAPVPPAEVSDGPVTENIQTGDDVDILQFPAPVWHQQDAGPYLVTGGASFLTDPDTGRLNVGCYRGLVYDRNTLGHHLAGGHHGQVIRDKYFERGRGCPILISLGHDPSLTLAAAENLAFGQDELEFGGFLRGEPFEIMRGPLTGLPMPASAEVVFEGEILHPDVEPRRIEGPWGEGLGYYTSGFPQPPVRIKAVYHRNDPIILGEPTLRFRNSGAAGGFARSGRRWHMLERSGLEGIMGVGQVGPYMVISVKQHYSGQALRIADFAMSGLADRPPRFLVLVDDDIDPTDRQMVEWAINTRVDPASQVHIQRERWCNAINPAGLTPDKRAIEDYTVGTMIIDACKPFRWRHQWEKMFKTSDIDEELRQRAAERWEGVLGEWMTAPKPLPQGRDS